MGYKDSNHTVSVMKYDTVFGPLCYVNHAANGGNNGTSWADAYTDLQSAMGNASCTEIWVAAGTYKPTTGTDRNATFSLISGVEIYGGFAGTESVRDERNPKTNVTILSGDAHYIFKGFAGTSTEVLRVEFRNSAGAHQIRAALSDDGTTWLNTNWFTISDMPHSVELDWRAATAAGMNDGGLTLWIDGTQQASLTGVDNDTRRVDRSRLGGLTGIDASTNGVYYFDAFESRKQNYIGP